VLGHIRLRGNLNKAPTYSCELVKEKSETINREAIRTGD
jgi:hypothetical protein